jgi:hypothetical protein
MTPNQKIEICKQTRSRAQKALFEVLEAILKLRLAPSEIEIRDLWLAQLQKNSAIFEDGWYSPPPHGIGLLMGSDNAGSQDHFNFASLRPESSWPRKDIRLDTENGLLFAYASPFDKKTGIIGDFQTTLYFGKKPEIINHLILCRKIAGQIFDYVKPGLTFSQISARLGEIISAHGLSNNIAYAKDMSAANDVVGHSIPFVAENMTEPESATLTGGDYDQIKQMISQKRQFVRNSNNQVVTAGMAFTIEPRPRVADNPSIPMVSFHCICAIHEDGTKELLTNFEELFRLCGMDYMEKI